MSRTGVCREKRPCATWSAVSDVRVPHRKREAAAAAGQQDRRRSTPLARRLTDSFLYFFPRASIAARTLGGDIGSSVSRVPTARSIALAIAAIGGQMLTSAAPLAP